jgi:hypothetical protein
MFDSPTCADVMNVQRSFGLKGDGRAQSLPATKVRKSRITPDCHGALIAWPADAACGYRSGLDNPPLGGLSRSAAQRTLARVTTWLAAAETRPSTARTRAGQQTHRAGSARRSGSTPTTKATPRRPAAGRSTGSRRPTRNSCASLPIARGATPSSTSQVRRHRAGSMNPDSAMTRPPFGGRISSRFVLRGSEHTARV